MCNRKKEEASYIKHDTIESDNKNITSIKFYNSVSDDKTIVPVNSLDAYIRRVNQIPLLTQKEEIELAKRYHKQDALGAAQKLVMSHLRYVVKVARGYMGYGLVLSDLIQEGTVGLMKAVKRFEPDRGVRLVSFAVHWIRAEIHEYILKNWRIVKVATTKAQRKLFFNLRGAKKRLGWFSQEEIELVAKELGVKKEEVVRMEQRLNMQDMAFDAPHSDQIGNKALLAPQDFLESSDIDPGLQWENKDWNRHNKEAFLSAFTKLDERSQLILKRRWLDENKATLKELANKYKVSQERIRQLENNAIKKLKKFMV